MPPLTARVRPDQDEWCPVELDGRTRLELDHAELPDVPEGFRER